MQAWRQAPDGSWQLVEVPGKRTVGDIIFRVIALTVGLGVTAAVIFAVLWFR